MQYLLLQYHLAHVVRWCLVWYGARFYLCHRCIVAASSANLCRRAAKWVKGFCLPFAGLLPCCII